MLHISAVRCIFLDFQIKKGLQLFALLYFKIHNKERHASFPNTRATGITHKKTNLLGNALSEMCKMCSTSFRRHILSNEI